MENKGRVSVEFRDRTKRFAAWVIRMYVALDKSREEVRVCGRQFLRAGTSVAAHVREASRGRSDCEFVSKLGGALQEADEAILWLELLREECGVTHFLLSDIESEGQELIAIMVTMIRRTNDKA
jgi:four helix bundle protein